MPERAVSGGRGGAGRRQKTALSRRRSRAIAGPLMGRAPGKRRRQRPPSGVARGAALPIRNGRDPISGAICGLVAGRTARCRLPIRRDATTAASRLAVNSRLKAQNDFYHSLFKTTPAHSDLILSCGDIEGLYLTELMIGEQRTNDVASSDTFKYLVNFVHKLQRNRLRTIQIKHYHLTYHQHKTFIDRVRELLRASTLLNENDFHNKLIVPIILHKLQERTVIKQNVDKVDEHVPPKELREKGYEVPCSLLPQPSTSPLPNDFSLHQKRSGKIKECSEYQFLLLKRIVQLKIANEVVVPLQSPPDPSACSSRDKHRNFPTSFRILGVTSQKSTARPQRQKPMMNEVNLQYLHAHWRVRTSTPLFLKHD
ncbi:Protein of unknown function [Gryllus bimaculatus]|nr:Protein of unknown function [Gryllus bimaculatus]